MELVTQSFQLDDGVGMLSELPAAAVLKSLLEALESAGLGCTMFISHADKRLERVYANDALARIWGVDLETLRNLPAAALFTPEQKEQLFELYLTTRPGDPIPPTIATTLLRMDGTEVPVELALGKAPIGDALALFVFARDLTAKVAMESALRESEERFRQLAEASPDAITVHANGRYVYANPAALGLLDLRSVGQLETFDPVTRIPQDLRDELCRYVALAAQRESTSPLFHRYSRPDGKEVVLETSISFMTFRGTSAIISWTRDITVRTRLQAELMRQDRLASVGFLAAGVAHELNNPLTSLRMQARKLRDDADVHGLAPGVRAALEQIDDAAQRMTTIISDLLFMARPVEQPQAHVDVAGILSSTLALLRAGIASCPPVTLDIEPLPPIRGYASKLGQVFLNVLRNAVQAVEGMPDGSIHVRARALRRRLEIVIADNGTGISPDVVPRLMQPFFTTKPNGTGLGLWISQTLLSHQGGGLELSSAPGKGTNVVISLPLCEASVSASSSPPP